MIKIIPLSLFTALLLTMSPVLAQGVLAGSGTSVSPSVIKIDLERGADATSQITVKNNSQDSINISLSLRAFRLDGVDSGAMIFPKNDDFSSQLLGWTKLGVEKIALAPQQEEVVDIVIQTPRSVSIEDLLKKHYLAVIVSPEELVSTSGTKIKQEITPAIIAQFQIGFWEKLGYRALQNIYWVIILVAIVIFLLRVFFARKKEKAKRFWEKSLE